MRIVTWNACKGQFDRKIQLLDRLNADIAVVQEIASPMVRSGQVQWFGDNVNQGLAVVAREPYRVTALPQHEGTPKFVIPLWVDGPVSFVLFAVWTLGQQPMRYVRAASTAIDIYKSIFTDHHVVMLGDFNSNSIWDKHHPSDLNHSSMVKRLQSHEMVSAYHYVRDEAHGQETEHTFYLHWNEDKPYHIDYCFLPEKWAHGITNVEVGSFAAWQSNSDHRPLLVEVEPMSNTLSKLTVPTEEVPTA